MSELNDSKVSTEKTDKSIKPEKRKRVNVRRPEVMDQVSAEVKRHYESSIVERIKQRAGEVIVGKTTIRLAQEFGFCYGVERAIDLAYAARRVFPDNRIFLIGEIIHNPEVNNQLIEMGIVSLPWKQMNEEYDALAPDDVVIVPAFGAPTPFMEKIADQGCYVIDTTCGDVMKVWRRVKSYAKEGVTSIIHGKAGHEETAATASRALGESQGGHYLIILTLADTDFLCDYIINGGDKAEFYARFPKGYSEGFDPEEHLQQVGVANQTTMLKSETLEIQNRIKAAIDKRDTHVENFRFFDTICGATQERQDALFDMLEKPLDALFVVGGYNSSNTTHLVEIGEETVPSFFIRNAQCLAALDTITHFDLQQKTEVQSSYPQKMLSDEPVTIGITAGASCPSNLIEDTVISIFKMRGVSKEEVLNALPKLAEKSE